MAETRTITRIDPSTGEREVQGKFTLEADGSVTSEYTDGALAFMIEHEGIFAGVDELTRMPIRLTPKDGKRFFEVLARTFGASSFVAVE